MVNRLLILNCRDSRDLVLHAYPLNTRTGWEPPVYDHYAIIYVVNIGVANSNS